jgi:hypothetical protein
MGEILGQIERSPIEGAKGLRIVALRLQGGAAQRGRGRNKVGANQSP